MVTLINNGNLAVDIPRGGSSFPLFQFEFRMFVFMEEGKPEGKLSERRQEPTTNSTHMSNITLPLFVLVTIRDS